MTTYQINMPNIPTNMYSFNFSTSVAGGGWNFSFIFINSHWTCYATPPSNTNSDLQLIREAAVYNNNIAWSGYPDYCVLFASPIAEPGINDINNVSMYLIDRRS